MTNTSVQIYEAQDRYGEVEVFGCAYGHVRSYALGEPAECSGGPNFCGGIREEVLGGPFAAYEQWGQSSSGKFQYVIVRDLRTGRVLRKVPRGASNSSGEIGDGFTRGIVVKDDGSVAWIVAGGVARGGNQVHVVDKSGSRVLASGTDIDPESLALAVNILYWMQGGKSFSALLN